MIPRVEHIGSPSSQSWAKRARQFFRELFGSKHVQFLEREIIQLRLERDRQVSELRAENARMFDALMAVKQIPIRSAIQPAKPSDPNTVPPLTSFQQMQAQAIADNAHAEEEDRKKAATAKEN